VYGLEAISANNGWAMAVTGAIIVMCGLSILSFIISQLHKIIALFEKKVQPEAYQATTQPSYAQLSAEIDILNDLPSAARIYRALTECLGEKFELALLYKKFQDEELPHPHITIRALRDGGLLVPAGECTFCWKED
jgi:hypothetical protein